MEEIVKDYIIPRLKKGGILYAIGNGGSSSEASHLVGELIGKFRDVRAPIRAISLTDPCVLTCIANDFGYEHIYSRQLSALLHNNDILIAFTTSGKSPNILKALDIANQKGCYTVCICGENYLNLNCNYILNVNESRTDKVQEEHIKYVHKLVELIENRL